MSHQKARRDVGSLSAEDASAEGEANEAFGPAGGLDPEQSLAEWLVYAEAEGHLLVGSHRREDSDLKRIQIIQAEEASLLRFSEDRGFNQAGWLAGMAGPAMPTTEGHEHRVFIRPDVVVEPLKHEENRQRRRRVGEKWPLRTLADGFRTVTFPQRNMKSPTLHASLQAGWRQKEPKRAGKGRLALQKKVRRGSVETAPSIGGTSADASLAQNLQSRPRGGEFASRRFRAKLRGPSGLLFLWLKPFFSLCF